MGKGDKRSRMGKIWRGSFGNSRPRPSKIAAEKKKEQQEAERDK
jgi:30S ribosomal protein S31